jgi:imidazolonepropionase-like amidohydrolase
MITLLLAATLAADDSTVYPVLNHGRPAGSMVVARHGDTTTVRFVFTDRNRGTRAYSRYVTHDGRVLSIENRPILPDDRLGDPTFRFGILGDSIRQWTPARTTSEPLQRDVFYAIGFSPFDEVALARHLLRQPTHTAKLSGNGTAHLEVVKELTVPVSRGTERVRLVSIDRGFGGTPQMIWIDQGDNLFATEVSWFMTVKPGAEPALPALRKTEFAVRDAQAEAFNKRLRKPTAGTLAIVNGDVFDSERGVMRPRTTVVVRGDRIVAVGPSDSVAVPQGTTVIDAAGKTVMPGMWEMHGHMQLTSETTSGPMQLSFGITTVRDLASDVDVAVSERDRAQAGAIASPHMVLAGFIEGPGKWAGPTAVLVRTEDEARHWVARYDSLGYRQIKVYNLVHPDLIPTIATEAHARGMRLSGHIPRGLTVPNAIQLGFDEVNHAAFLFSTFYQDSLYVPTMRAYSAVATAVAANVEVDGPAMTQLIDLFKRRGTVIDGTFSVWVTSAGTGIGQSVGAGVPADVQKADANYMRLLKRLYDAGVTLVAGTDAFGSTSYYTELGLYEKAGIPAPMVLQIATIGAARVMKDDKDYGSLTVGKVADIIVVNGRPIDHISDVSKVETVIRAGRLYDAQELRLATGLARR